MRDEHRRGLTLVEVVVAVAVLAVAGLSAIVLGQDEAMRSRGMGDRACAADLCWNLCAVIEPLGGAFLERGTPDGDGHFAVADVASQAWVPPAYGQGALNAWITRKGARMDLLWQPAQKVSPTGDTPPIGVLTCTVTWREGKDRTRSVRIHKLIRR